MILDGKKIAGKLYKELRSSLASLEGTPKLWAILVGNNSESLRYIGQKKRFAQKIGMDFELKTLPVTLSWEELENVVDEFNARKDISGYIVQLPLPAHIDAQKIINRINPSKDVDGFHPLNQGKVLLGQDSGFVPCTPAGILYILEKYNISLAGKKIVILGRSAIVGKPLAALCINSWATVTSCNALTPDISLYTQTADIVICATGKKHILKASMISPQAIVIDVGFSVIDEKIYGDADYENILLQGNSITPVPGGVGPMTVAMLLQNTYFAYLQGLWNSNSEK